MPKSDQGSAPGGRKLEANERLIEESDVIFNGSPASENQRNRVEEPAVFSRAETLRPGRVTLEELLQDHTSERSDALSQWIARSGWVLDKCGRAQGSKCGGASPPFGGSILPCRRTKEVLSFAAAGDNAQEIGSRRIGTCFGLRSKSGESILELRGLVVVTSSVQRRSERSAAPVGRSRGERSSVVARRKTARCERVSREEERQARRN